MDFKNCATRGSWGHSAIDGIKSVSIDSTVSQVSFVAYVPGARGAAAEEHLLLSTITNIDSSGYTDLLMDRSNDDEVLTAGGI